MRSLRVAWQRDREYLTAVAGRLSPDPAAKDLYQVLRNRKTQPETPSLPWTGAIHLIEPLEHPAPVFGGDSGAVVPNADADLAAGDLGVNVDRSANGREFGGVVKQVVERLNQFRPVGCDSQWRGHVGVHGPVNAHTRHTLAHQLPEVKRCPLDRHRFGLDVTELPEVVDDFRQKVGLLDDPLRE